MKGRQEPIYLLISLIHFFFSYPYGIKREMNREREIRIKELIDADAGSIADLLFIHPLTLNNKLFREYVNGFQIPRNKRIEYE